MASTRRANECSLKFKFLHMSDKSVRIEEAGVVKSKLNEVQSESSGNTLLLETSTSSSDSFEESSSGNGTPVASCTDFELIGKHEVILDFVKEEPPEYPNDQVLQHNTQDDQYKTIPCCPNDNDNNVMEKLLKDPKAKGTRKPHSKYNCSECGDEFKYRYNLYYHRKKNHDAEITPKNISNDQPVESSKEEHADLKSESDRKNTRVKSQQCLLCPKAYYTAGHLTDHLRRAHWDPTFKCEVCGKMFHDPGDFRSHKIRHSTEKPFECPFCPAKFRHRVSLSSHKNVHVTDKKFKCDMCSAAFVRAFCLQRHKLGHNPRTEFPCTLCSRIFIRKCQLKEHLITHSEEKPFVCDVCGKGHKRARSLKDHVRKNHTVVGI